MRKIKIVKHFEKENWKLTHDVSLNKKIKQIQATYTVRIHKIGHLKTIYKQSIKRITNDQ